MTSVSRQNGQLAYEIFGDGDEVLLAFHGFGQDRKVFKAWAKKLHRQYKIYAFDLFFHGESKRNHVALTKQEWNEWIRLFLEKEKIDRFSALGYSLGGRFAICTAIQQNDRINELILIAPDGIFLTPWFKLATTPGLKFLFKYLMLNPNKLEKLIEMNNFSKIVNTYVADFVRKEMGDEENRKRVYFSWNYFKTLGYSKKKLIRIFKEASFRRKLVIGEKDQIIHPREIIPIVEKMCCFEITCLPLKHHHLIKPEVAELLIKR